MLQPATIENMHQNGVVKTSMDHSLTLIAIVVVTGDIVVVTGSVETNCSKPEDPAV